MPFRFDEFVALVKAGYTKEEIDAMERAESAPEPKEEKPENNPATPEKSAEKPTEAPAETIPADSKLDALQAEITALRKAIQALNVKNAYRIDDNQATPESILASIIQPAKNER